MLFLHTGHLRLQVLQALREERWESCFTIRRKDNYGIIIAFYLPMFIILAIKIVNTQTHLYYDQA